MPLENPDKSGALPRLLDALRAVETGADVIGRHAKTAPAGPGVYRMFDAAGEVLYVGKARHLKKRVLSYARGAAHNNRIARMIADTANMEFVTTATEISRCTSTRRRKRYAAPMKIAKMNTGTNMNGMP